MTKSPESRVEELLGQMSLKEASDDLNLRIGECLTADSVVAAGTNRAKQTSRPSWFMLAAVAVLCLFLGGLIGRNTEQSAVAGESGANGGADVDSLDLLRQHKAVNEKVESGEVIVELDSGDNGASIDSAEANVEVPVTVRKTHPSSKFRSPFVKSLTTPAVGMVCAVTSASGTNEGGCLTCHSGLTAAREQFRKHHEKHPEFQTCMWCHDVRDAIHPSGSNRFNDMMFPSLKSRR